MLCTVFIAFFVAYKFSLILFNLADFHLILLAFKKKFLCELIALVEEIVLEITFCDDAS